MPEHAPSAGSSDQEPNRTVGERLAEADAFDFRGLHPAVRFGTASDRYAGWIGQIYPDSFASRVSSRKRRLAGRTFEERTLPVESVASYFDHFSVLELDFTFYRPLLEEDGTASSNYHVLREYAEHAPDHARFLLKAPQQYFARTLRRSRDGKTFYEDNPSFLDADGYRLRFHQPALDLLGDRLAGLIFEQEYQRVRESPAPEENVAELDAFFGAIPDDVQAHLELRSAHLLVPAYMNWLEARGLGFVFSHWTWLPELRKQWRLCGGRFAARDRTAVVRLLTPLNVPYAKAYAQAYPFDRAVPELAASDQTRRMIDDATALAYQAIEQDAALFVIANNRAYGNAPELARAIAHRFLDFADLRGA